MKHIVAGFAVLFLLSALAQAQTLRICRGVPIPDGYIIVANEKSASCKHGAYVLKKNEESPTQSPTASRPRRVGNAIVNSIALAPPQEISNAVASPPELHGPLSRTLLDPPASVSSATSLDDPEEVAEGDVIRIDTNLVTVPVGVLDRDGRFISDLRRKQFKVFENGVEQMERQENDQRSQQRGERGFFGPKPKAEINHGEAEHDDQHDDGGQWFHGIARHREENDAADNLEDGEGEDPAAAVSAALGGVRTGIRLGG